MKKATEDKNYDLIIIGAGPAGLTGSIYASRYGLSHLVIGILSGGTMTEAHKIENFPSQIEISGLDLAKKMEAQVRALGARIKLDKVVDVKKLADGIFRTKTRTNQNFFSKAILLAPGTRRRKLNIPGQDRFLGRGVSYCATCDGPFFKDKVVAVIGGSDAAAMSTLYLATLAKKVYLIYRKDRLRAEEMRKKEIGKNKKITVLYNNNVKKLEGKDFLGKIILERPYRGSNELKLDGVFVEVGSVPSSVFIDNLGLAKDESGYIKIDSNGATNVKGIWAAGDITNGSNGLRQIITACSEGAVAIQSIYNYRGRVAV